jgi:hypothetical protein
MMDAIDKTTTTGITIAITIGKWKPPPLLLDESGNIESSERALFLLVVDKRFVVRISVRVAVMVKADDEGYGGAAASTSGQ